ncbi:ankyrin repeat and SOCS box protein 8-like [Asterias rubens]|uniref:ankyrin repeat and SOCS box protein 8-like n=1 Tax=Asterias rubens TaxID=7604 RepID=UPI001455C5B4|nr:ankyrin repeat and SOCS box protein 8-like [Asterias rubens]
MTSLWYLLEMAQNRYALSERLIRAISGWTIHTQESIEGLIAEGVDINQAHGTLLPLHCACMAGDSECIKLLIQNGAEVNAVDGYSRTALHYAAEKDSECTSLLLEYGADVNAPDGNDDTPLHWASFRNNADCAKVLLKHHASVDALDSNHDTPLSWASMKGNLECMMLLLEYGAEPNTINCSGASPLLRVSNLFAMGLSRDRDLQCLNLLSRAIGQFDLRDLNGDFPRSVEGDAELKMIMTDLCCSPRYLRQQCRYNIRRSLMDGKRTRLVDRLPLPPPLQRYLLLNE